MVEQDLPPEKIVPVNSPQPGYAKVLASNMKEHGWNGRRILVEEITNKRGTAEYYAWTGSHRIEAAKLAGLKTVPCFVLTPEETDVAFTAAGYEHWKTLGCNSWRAAIRAADPRAISDKGRRTILEDAGLKDAAEIVSEEIKKLEEREKLAAKSRER